MLDPFFALRSVANFASLGLRPGSHDSNRALRGWRRSWLLVDEVLLDSKSAG